MSYGPSDGLVDGPGNLLCHGSVATLPLGLGFIVHTFVAFRASMGTRMCINLHVTRLGTRSGRIQLMQWLAVAAILAMVCAAVGGSQSKTGREDPLLDKLIGKWTITRKFPNRTVTNTAECAWVLQHQYVKIHMKDTAQPSQYEAEIFIGYDEEKKRYVAHWIDVFGGGFSATLGFGTKKGNQIEFEFKYPDGELKNTFTWHEDLNTWTSEIIQQDEKGTWVPFCTDTYRRM